MGKPQSDMPPLLLLEMTSEIYLKVTSNFVGTNFRIRVSHKLKLATYQASWE